MQPVASHILKWTFNFMLLFTLNLNTNEPIRVLKMLIRKERCFSSILIIDNIFLKTFIVF